MLKNEEGQATVELIESDGDEFTLKLSLAELTVIHFALDVVLATTDEGRRGQTLWSPQVELADKLIEEVWELIEDD